jgi:hypothetical protein
MANPPRSVAEKSLSDPRRRPIPVRAPPTMTVGSALALVMRGLLRMSTASVDERQV